MGFLSITFLSIQRPDQRTQLGYVFPTKPVRMRFSFWVRELLEIAR
jgi:hypothetical protein